MTHSPDHADRAAIVAAGLTKAQREASSMTDPRLLSELARVKVLFQARALATAMGIPSPVSLPKDERA